MQKTVGVVAGIGLVDGPLQGPTFESALVCLPRDFSRAGAVLKVEVLDRDFTNADDELGGFEIKIGEELLSQKVKT